MVVTFSNNCEPTNWFSVWYLELHVQIFSHVKVRIFWSKSDFLSPFCKEKVYHRATFICIEYPRIVGHNSVHPSPDVSALTKWNIGTRGDFHFLHKSWGQLLPLSRLVESKNFRDVTNICNEITFVFEKIIASLLRRSQLVCHYFLWRLGVGRIVLLFFVSHLVIRNNMRDQSVRFTFPSQESHPEHHFTLLVGTQNIFKVAVLHYKHERIFSIFFLFDICSFQRHGPNQLTSSRWVNVEAIKHTLFDLEVTRLPNFALVAGCSKAPLIKKISAVLADLLSRRRCRLVYH
mmetsp:Transcript_6556/g.14223  ORF Transcript_6556/g.14223 Transcript_6556/m.14223 type:complete len:290 (+) Transcript_6556:1630-2499(+)